VPGLAVVTAAAEPGTALHEWLSATYRADPADHARLVGHAQNIQSLRTRLRALGLPPECCRHQAVPGDGPHRAESPS
jgi:hypothetical protein